MAELNPHSLTEFLPVLSHHIEIQWHGDRNSKKPVLVFLHEGLGCVEMWKDFPETVSRKTRCPALVFSRPGYGQSSPNPLPWKINFMHHQALKLMPALIQQAAISQFILIGHSDGGSISLIFAGSPGIQERTRLKGVITLAAHVFCEKITADAIRQAKTAYENGTLKKGLEKYHGKNCDNAFYGWNGVWLNPKFMLWNIEKYLHKIEVPLLAIQGKQDQYGTARQLERLRKGVHHMKPVMLENCQHSPHTEQKEKSLAAMTQFINTIVSQ